MSDTEAPKVELIHRTLKMLTEEQWGFLLDQLEKAVKPTGFARVQIEFQGGHVRFLFAAPGLEFPKP